MKKGILKNLQKNTCAKVFSLTAILLKIDSGRGASCEFWEIFKNTLSAEHLRPTTSESNSWNGQNDKRIQLNPVVIDQIY